VQTVTSAAPVALNALSGFETAFGADAVGCTIVRTLIRLQWYSGTLAGGELASGLIIAPVGMTAAQLDPSLATHDYLDWMWITDDLQLNPLAAVPGLSSNIPRDSQIDLRSRRKITDVGQQLYWCAGTTGTASSIFTAYVRMLLLMP